MMLLVLKKLIIKLLNLKIITSYGKSGITKRIQLPENNIICRILGHVYSRKSKSGTGYDASNDHCFRCGLSNWDGPWG